MIKVEEIYSLKHLRSPALPPSTAPRRHLQPASRALHTLNKPTQLHRGIAPARARVIRAGGGPLQRAMANPILFEDIFEVQIKDPDGKRFDKVSRFVCRSELFEFDLVLDVNIDIYPLNKGDKVSLALSRTIFKDNTPELGEYNKNFPGISGKESLMDSYDYVMHGKVYKYKDDTSSGSAKVEVFVSFGGLLMKIVGDPAKLKVLEVDANVYLLMRKLQ